MLITTNPKTLNLQHSNPLDDLHPEEQRWFAIRVGNRKEKVVVKQLERDGIQTFLPLRDRPFSYKSKTGVRKIPLLGGYLFVKITQREALKVLQPNFVFGFVKLGTERRQIRQEEIDLLRRLSSDNSLEWVVEEKLASLQPGQLVEICRGPLSGVRGHYVNAKNKKTFIISFGGLDARLMTCEVSPKDVVPLDGEVLNDAPPEDEGKKKLW
ncbi:transcription antitermination factor NusG [Neolewinella xylanilytica]|uniref:Transcription antitermination factor NusG n=1 Tax=Neolewinella xylanilytica TaxID=1514080 RepID=A0A2S6I8Y1_9BACT|nr:transcription termination/antitermination NusG family protein [Neolewinella xylanilytica]PPK87951.1 transcription antitermination factor NusG [Neolewinella xylanilytica]